MNIYKTRERIVNSVDPSNLLSDEQKRKYGPTMFASIVVLGTLFLFGLGAFAVHSSDERDKKRLYNEMPAFRQYDVSGNGVLEPEEVRCLLRDYMPKPQQTQP